MTTSTENEARLTGLLRTAVWGGAGLLMLAPFVATLLTDEMAWDANDFVVWGAMLLAACGAFEAAVRMSSNWAYRAAAVVAVGTAFLLVWISLAVGVIGSQDDLYLGVLVIGFAGALGAGGRPDGIARTLAAMAVATALIGVAAVAFGWGSEGANWPQVAILANGIFAAAWLLSAWLFRRAARELTPAGAAP